jgi:mono/diheme cytochrome c family protein
MPCRVRTRQCMAAPSRPASATSAAVLSAVGVLATLAAGPAPAADLDSRFTARVRPLLAAYCADCHGGATPEAELDLTSWTTLADVQRDFTTWRTVLQQIEEREMPPEDPQPTEAERAELAGLLREALDAIDWSARRGVAHVTLPRLTKAEYGNTLRDLLGVDLRPQDMLLDDGPGLSGFTTDRDGLFISPALAEQYFDAADYAVRAALALRDGPHELVFEAEEMLITERRARPAALADGSQGYVLRGGGQMTLYAEVEVPTDGWYRVAVRALGVGGESGMRLRIDNEPRADFNLAHDTMGEQSAEILLRAGAHQMTWNIELPPRLKALVKDAEKKKKQPGSPGIDWVRLAGPVVPAAGDTERVAGLFTGDARSLLDRFLPRAFRRPLRDGELARHLALHDAALARGESPDEALALALSAALASPHFLFRDELVGRGADGLLDDFQLASRLSFFLWMSMPDDELFALAAAGRLHDERELRGQVRRMLADPKTRAFTAAFLGQWLGFAGIGTEHVPDARRFPEFTPTLAEAMKLEPVLVFEDMLRGRGTLIDFLDGRETLVGAELAGLYGLGAEPVPQAAGSTVADVRRVTLPGDDRGGLLGMAAVLTASSTPNRTSPVLRGKWVLENLLGRHLAEPPADAGQLDDKAGSRGKTLRQELAAHRRNASCASCHDRIDPIGFGLEHFDAIGRFRETEARRPVDARGQLPGGVPFVGPAEMRRLLVERHAAEFAANVVRRLTSFALGRSLLPEDEGLVLRLAGELERNGHRADTLVEAIVVSEAFRSQPSGDATAGTVR